jgi:putative ABC transport system permease protein
MSGLCRDVRHTLRLLARNRGFAAAVLVTIALGVGGATAVFSVVHGVLLRPLPYPHPDRLVRLWEVHRGAHAPVDAPLLTNLTYQSWARSSATLESLGAFEPGMHTVANAGPIDRLRGARVTPSLFGVLRVAAVQGRLFGEADVEKGASKVVVLTHATWRSRFGGAPVLGKLLTIDGEDHRVVGVAPPGFAFPGPEAERPSDDRRTVSFYTPLAVPDMDGFDAVEAIGRLEDGVTAVQAEAEGTSLARAVERPAVADLILGKGGPVDVRARALVEQMTTRVRPALIVLAAGVSLLLLIVCANVANLFLLRSTGRARELPLRAALGAGRWRIVQQLLTESLVVSLMGGGLGMFVGWAMTAAVPLVAPSNFPRLDNVHVDWPFLIVAALASACVGVCAGVLPASRGSRLDLATTIGAGSRSVSTPDTISRRLLLIVEAALAVVLLVGATLLARSFVKIMQVDTGYDPTNVLTADLIATPASDTSRLAESVLERLRGIAGVRVAGAGSMAPFGNMIISAGFQLPGMTTADGRPLVAQAYYAVITPGYAEALGMRLLEGRFFREADVAAPVLPMLVNASFARRYFTDGKAATGRRFSGLFAGDSVVEVVGVVADVLPASLDAEPQAQIYTLHGRAMKMGNATLVVRTDADPSTMAPLLRQLVRQLEPGASLDQVGSLGSRISASVSEPRFTALVLAAFSGLALALAATGLYGVLSYTVAQRRREIGLRAALGATRAELMAMVLREGLGVTAVGLALGMAVAALAMRATAKVLFGVAPLDAVAFSVAPLLLVVVAFAACLLPAWRAATIDPVAALSAE